MGEELSEDKKEVADKSDIINQHSLSSAISNFLPRNNMGLFDSRKLKFDAFQLIEKLFRELLGEKFREDTRNFAKDHPVLFTVVSIVCFFLTAPVLMTLGFCVTLAVIGLICFLCFEGSILFIGGFLFVAVIVSAAVIVIAMMSSVAALYWLIQKIILILKRGKASIKESEEQEK